MNKKTVIITLVAVLVVGYLLFQEFGGGNEVVTAPQSAVVDVPAVPVIVEEAEEEQITRELAAQSKRGELSKDYIVKCAPCHNRDGSGPVGAPIAWMSKDELVKALREYKTGERKNSLMENLMKNVSDNDIDRLAEEIAAFK